MHFLCTGRSSDDYSVTGVNGSSADADNKSDCGDDILERILQSLESWELNIYDAEYRYEQVARIEKRIEETLTKQFEDAAITRHDYDKLKDLLHTWTSLIYSLTSHRTSSNEHVKLQVITWTLKLHRLGYICPVLASDIFTSL